MQRSSRCFAEPGPYQATAFVTAPALQRTASQELRAALRPGNESANLQNSRDAAISPAFIARTGEICMTIVISQIAPSRPMLMLDACLAL